MSTISVPQRALPVGNVGSHAVGWWGIVAGILTEAALFAYLLFGYYYFAIQPHGVAWPAELPTFKLSAPNTIILLVSSAAVWWGERGAKEGSIRKQVTGLGMAFVLGVAFVVIQTFEWKAKSFSLNSGAYGSLFFTITGFHVAHVIFGLIMLLPLTVWSALGYFGPRRSAPVSIGAIYWHFVDAVWLTVFFTIYITPYLGLRHGS
jgi:cytochrome c oxidase subunit 3